MLMKYIFSLLITGFFFEQGNAVNSDGKEFVFTFVQNSFIPLSAAATTTVIVIPSYNDTVCSFKYTQNSDSQVVTLQEMAIFGVTNEFTLNIKEIIVQSIYDGGNPFYPGSSKDFRIFVSCTEEVKLIGKIADPVNGWGDMFLIPSLKNAGTQYTFATPTTDDYAKGTIAILPVNKEGSININIVGYMNSAFFSNQTIQYDATLGQNQYYVSVWYNSNENGSIAITTSSPVMLSFEAPSTTTSNLDGSCGSSCNRNFVQFMPIASQPLQCNSFLMPPDQRMITNDFTTRLHVSPPNLGANCNAITKITVYDENNNIGGTEQIVDKMGFTKISLINDEVAGFSTYGGQMSTNRLGSILDEDEITAHGHFMHYVPSTSEWITGKTQFYTLTKDCMLEFYTNQDGGNADLIKIDGNILGNLEYDRKPLPIFKNKYLQFVVKIKGYGLHTFENGGNYVAYVICKNVNGYNDAAGYLTGFNQRK